MSDYDAPTFAVSNQADERRRTALTDRRTTTVVTIFRTLGNTSDRLFIRTAGPLAGQPWRRAEREYN
jgi:hypothetical protein